uniref:Uncharacterized protein n=1 Tax=Siphoviridae sp. ctwfx1 TaxID=2825732 RepID=A0A8S5UVN5_9CAUD|nr:MAG TPA: hypothetical protein [Siphoviridae sp. ctwfx1]
MLSKKGEKSLSIRELAEINKKLCPIRARGRKRK